MDRQATAPRGPTLRHWLTYGVGLLLLPLAEAGLIAYAPRHDGIVHPSVTIVATMAFAVVSVYGAIVFAWLVRARRRAAQRQKILAALALIVLWGILTLISGVAVIYVAVVVGCMTGLSCL